MSEPAAAPPCLISSNPDVSGIGVRISVYVMTLLAILIDMLGDERLQTWLRKRLFAKPNKKRFESDYKVLQDSFRNTLGISGIMMVLTAIVQSALQALSLLHAICLMFYTVMILMPFFGTHRLPSGRLTMVLYGITSFASEGWVFYFVLNADTFGGECNAEVWQATKRFNGRVINRNLVMALTIMAMVFSVLTLLHVMLPESVTHRLEYRKQQQQSWRTFLVRGHTMLNLVLWPFLVVRLESIITKSKSHITDGEADWTFGQMLAIGTLLGPVLEFCSLVYKWRHPEEDDCDEGEDLWGRCT